MCNRLFNSKMLPKQKTRKFQYCVFSIPIPCFLNIKLTHMIDNRMTNKSSGTKQCCSYTTEWGPPTTTLWEIWFMVMPALIWLLVGRQQDTRWGLTGVEGEWASSSNYKISDMGTDYTLKQNNKDEYKRRFRKERNSKWAQYTGCKKKYVDFLLKKM